MQQKTRKSDKLFLEMKNFVSIVTGSKLKAGNFVF